MTTPAAYDSEEILTFWFGDLDEHGRADEAHVARWWKKDAAFDEAVRQRFGAVHEAVAKGACDAWLESPRGRLAYIIVLDQLSRNMFRGTAGMFAEDAKALAAALEGIERGVDKGLGHDERTFFYMPLMHSEDAEVQQRCVDAFASFRDELTGDRRARVEYNLKFAEQHRDIILRFGRYPHRNELLGRASTPEELTFLTQPGSSF
jgi:uncharacterized protein (DUF924 family)